MPIYAFVRRDLDRLTLHDRGQLHGAALPTRD